MNYYLFDRLSNRHKWQIIGSWNDVKFLEHFKNVQLNIFERWEKKNKFPDYQLGIIESDEIINHDSTLPVNYNMTYVLLFKNN